jgi:short-subunit dehydrogenase
MGKPRTPRTILVTGATSGIGRHAALALAEAGHHVLATGRRAEALAEVCAARPGRITPLRLDLDEPSDVARIAREVEQLTGGRGVDVLINNAGYATAGALSELPDARLRAQFETNVFGLMALTRALLPAMLDRGEGRVLNVSSVSGRMPAPLLGAYHASKYALEALSDALRMELAPLGVRVVLIEPGTIRSEFAARTMGEVEAARGPATRYAAVYERAAAMQARFAQVAADPIHVTRAIVRAVEARRPAARYVAPRRFLALIALVRLLPTCLVDAAMRRGFGLTAANLPRGGAPA